MSRLMRSCRLSWIALALAPPIVAQTKDLVYNPVPNCVAVYTSAPFAANEIRTYNVVGSGSFASQGGSSTGCGVPGFSNGIAQAQAVEINVVALAPAANGHLVLYPADLPVVRTMVNFTAGVTIADTGTVAVSQTPGVGDITIQASAATHVIVKVVGYYSKPVQTVYVHPVPGDHAASGTALLNALNGITNASATKRYVIKLEPGIYDLGSTELVMKPYVDIEGSGQQATVIQGVGNNDPFFTAVVEAAHSAEIRNLQIKSMGQGYGASIPLLIVQADTSVRDVTIISDGATANWGIRHYSSTAKLDGVNIKVQGGSSNYGISSIGGPQVSPVIKRTVIDVSGGTSDNQGIYCEEFNRLDELRDVQINVSGGSAYGVRIASPQPGGGAIRLTNSTIVAQGATSYGIFSGASSPIQIEQSQIRASGTNSYGVYAFGLADVTIDHSVIAGQVNTVSALYNAHMGATRLDGGTASGTCAGVYDESFAFFAGPACP